MTLGIFEILIICVVLYLILGPSKLVKLGKKAGEVAKTVNKESEQLTQEVREVKDIFSVKDTNKKTIK